jgi:hypothetical protein
MTTAPGLQTTQAAAPGRTVSIVGICLGVASILFSILTAIPGLICGIVGVSKGSRLGWWAIGFSVVIPAILISIAVANGGYHVGYHR